MNSKVLRGLCESYQDIYDDGFESWVESLLDEGYDLSDYTWDEMREIYLDEQDAMKGVAGPIHAFDTFLFGRKKADAAARNRGVLKSTQSATKPRIGSLPTSARIVTQYPEGVPTGVGGGNAGASRTPTKPAPVVPPKPGAGAKVAPTAAPKPKFTPQTGDKAKDTASWAKANPTLANKPKKTFNPLMQKTFGYQTGYAPDQIKNSPRKMAQTGSLKNISSSFEWGSASKVVDDIANAYSSIYEAKKKDQDQDGDNDFADVQIARMIASGMTKAQAIAAVRNKSYNEEYGIKVPAGASDAEALKGLIPKGNKVHEMKKKKPTLQNASYEPEADMVDEATRMRKELGKEGETATRKELAARSRAYKRSGSVDKTIAAAERGADRPYVKFKRDESDADRSKREEKQSRTLRGLASSRRGSVRDKPRVQLRGYAAKVEGSDKDLQKARSSAMSAGTLTPKEKKKMGEDFEIWIDTLLQEGYDLSDYTWDEMYDIYEETAEEREKRIAARRARVREMESQGRVMTSSRRTSERARQRRQEKKDEALERAANRVLADTIGTTRKSDKPMGSEAPAPKEAAPAANRRLGRTVKRDTLASRADQLLKMLQNEDFELWLENLIEEGYDLRGWTDGEIIDLYEEIIEEKYGS